MTGASSEEERYFANDSAYMLPSDDQEQKRLLKQHQFITHTFDDRLVLAPIKFADGDQILEVGAAAGAWLYDVAQQIGSSSKVKLHAIDIEDRLFPSKLPPNMSFSVASVLELPQMWAGRFSYVHQRLLMGALTEAQWPIAIQEIYRVLKPGGWIELSEGEGRVKCPDGPHDEHLRAHRIFHGFWTSRGLVVDIGSELPELLKAAGFVDIKAESKRMPVGRHAGDFGEAVLENGCGVLRAIKKLVLMKGGFGVVQTGEEYDAMIDEFEREVNSISGYTWGHTITYARKPEGLRN
ncbi:S-adenosyl-L-methionine-dependent methyltransferase [Macrolepiota fuliginosa MF-IS2]|uniref:S-adenosyl-L-methionine-dependent methyltransferase n=1 Tax=Macrolepiota fuliginosa MF-IS2 TaxID=1400762 RepID=A0A9P5WZ35_9AGAR|nr:S-adenosyl-L-methionine-dependent methyltransferase [Macrolepiota fuliginosa MF-IS2]